MLKTRERKAGARRRTGQIEIALLAPYNREASVCGTFSAWKDIPMQKGDDGIFRAHLDLADGTYEYLFKVRTRSWFFEADTWVDVVDPCAREVSLDGTHAVLNVARGRRVVDTYQWRHDDTPLPPNHQLVIYELHVGDFSGGEPDPFRRGQFTNVLEKLDYLAELGVNAIELMPLKDNPGTYSWGYNPRHFFAVDTSYGTSADLKRLVDECHGRGIRVFADGVYNHAETSSPLTQIDHDYWFRHDPKDPVNNWGPEFNYEHFDERLGLWPARQYIVDTIHYWVQEFHLDGIRFDAARQIANHDALYAFDRAGKEAAGSKPFYSMAEYCPQDPAVTNLEGPMDAAWHETFYFCVTEHLREESFDLERLKDAVDGRREGFMAAVNMVNYCSNHDHDHVLAQLGESGFVGDVAFRKRRQGAVLCFTAVGVPLLWMGEEWGECLAKTEGEAKIRWTLMGSEDNRALFDFYRVLVELRKSNPALWGENIEFFYEHAEQRVLAYRRWEGDQGLLVFVNLGGQDVTVAPPSWPEGHWECILGGEGEIEGALQLGPYDARVFLRE